MNLFEALVDEHRIIGRAVDALEGYARRLEDGTEVDPGDLVRLVCFFREFAELVHHDKEEHLLFPAMAEKGYLKDRAPLSDVCGQHRQERQIVRALQQLAVLKDPIDGHTSQVVSLLKQLVEFERAHMAKENEVLYPAVQHELAGASSLDLADELSVREQAERWIGDTTWLRDLADELYETYASASSV